MKRCSRMPAVRLLGLALSALLMPGPVMADEQEHYRVDLIIFKQSGNDNERWPTRPEPALFERYAELRDDVEEPDKALYRLLREEDHALNTTARRLRESDNYQILVHSAWIQPGIARQEAAAIAIPPGSEAPEVDNGEQRSVASANADDDGSNDGESPGEERVEAVPALGPRPPEGLSGWLRVARERYLHVHLDLRWIDPDSTEDEPLDRLHGALLEDMQPVVVMRDQRRMRSGELHYMDHPVLGVLIRINRVEQD